MSKHDRKVYVYTESNGWIDSDHLKYSPPKKKWEFDDTNVPRSHRLEVDNYREERFTRIEK